MFYNIGEAGRRQLINYKYNNTTMQIVFGYISSGWVKNVIVIF